MCIISEFCSFSIVIYKINDKKLSTNVLEYSIVVILKKNNHAAGQTLLILKNVEHEYISVKFYDFVRFTELCWFFFICALF